MTLWSSGIRRLRAVALLSLGMGIASVSHAQAFVSISIAPPVLPVYAQPAIPGDGYIWTPGYWAYGAAGYYWVPGTWVLPAFSGALWTPGYWGWHNGFYAWNAGYWGPHVGFYGGVNYGFGYTGYGYQGGYWRGGSLYYNRAVNNITINNIHNTYNTVVPSVAVSRVSYNGGTGGLRVEPTAEQRSFASERHVGATEVQMQHEHLASSNRELLATVNHGHPAIAATPVAGNFQHPGVVAAKNGPVNHPGNPAVAHDMHVNTTPHPGPNGTNHNVEKMQTVNHPPAGFPQGQSHPQGQVHPQNQMRVESQPHPQGGNPGGGAHPQGGGHPETGGHPEGGGHPQGEHKEEHH